MDEPKRKYFEFRKGAKKSGKSGEVVIKMFRNQVS